MNYANKWVKLTVWRKKKVENSSEILTGMKAFNNSSGIDEVSFTQYACQKLIEVH